MSSVSHIKSASHLLKKTRLEKGYKIGDVVKALCISEEYIKALESGECGRLPSPVYAVGFAKSYARFLGLDTETTHITQAFKEALGGVLAEATLVESQYQPSEGEKKVCLYGRSLELISNQARIFVQQKKINKFIQVIGILIAAIVGYKMIQKKPIIDSRYDFQETFSQEKNKSSFYKSYSFGKKKSSELTPPVLTEGATSLAESNAINPANSSSTSVSSESVESTSRPVTSFISEKKIRTNVVSNSAASSSQESLLSLAKSSINQSKNNLTS